MTETIVIPISAIEHFAYCPRQCAIIHCDGVWRDNRHIVKGTKVHRRADGGQHSQQRGKRILRSIPLWSETLGLSGRADIVEMDGANAYPVEYKAGVRHGNTADLQVCAQGLCLEEMLDIQVPHGFVWYGGPRRRCQVDFTPALRDEVRGAIEAIRAQIQSSILPDAPNDHRCRECQLLGHCVPALVNAPSKVSKYIDKLLYS